MSRKGVSMRKVREILRLRLGGGLSTRQVADSCRVSVGTVSEYERRARAAGLGWPLPADLDDTGLERIVRARECDFRHNRPLPDASYLITEMKRAHVTLHLLWLEYRESLSGGYGYTQFCHYYNQAKAKADLVLRQEHRAGEKLFTDYAGDTLKMVNPKTGEIIPVYVFVAVLGASNYTFAEGVTSLNVASWIGSHVKAFEFFGGVPEIVVPDNTKCAVIRPDRYEPDINPSFAEMAAHYGTAVIPTRVRKPRDKAKVENGVLVVERWIMAALRNRTFFCLTEIAEAIDQLLDRLNTRKFKAVNSTREQLFKTLDAPALKPLPANRYTFAEWRSAKVNIDYHISVAKHLYSVPYQLATEQTRCASDGDHSRGFLQEPARSQSHPKLPRRRRNYTRRAYARQPSQVPGVDTVTHHQLGRAHRTGDRGTCREHNAHETPSRNGLSFLPWDHPAGQGIRHRKAGSRLRTST